MKTSDLSRIKKFMAGPERRRLDELYAAHSRFPEHVDNPRSRRAVTKQFISAVREINSGRIDYREFERQFAEIIAKDTELLQAAARDLREAAVKKSGAAQKVLDAEMASRFKGLDQLVAVGSATVASPKYQLLKAPFEIVASAGLSLEAAESIPVKSFVKFRIELDRKSFFGTVQFNYLWQNLSDKFAVINVDGYMIFHGHGWSAREAAFVPAQGTPAIGSMASSPFCSSGTNLRTSLLSSRTRRLRCRRCPFGQMGSVRWVR